MSLATAGIQKRLTVRQKRFTYIQQCIRQTAVSAAGEKLRPRADHALVIAMAFGGGGLIHSEVYIAAGCTVEHMPFGTHETLLLRLKRRAADRAHKTI